MTTTCPKCGFSYGWDGATCRHCDPPAPDPAVPPLEPEATERSVGALDRIAALVVFSVLGIVFGMILGGVLGGWEALKDFVRSTAFGGGGKAGNSVETVQVYVFAGLAVGAVVGILFAWELTRRGKRRRSH